MIYDSLITQYRRIYMNQLNHKRGFSEKDAAQYLGMSRSFLSKARMNGYLHNHIPAPKFSKAGRKVLYLREDLDSWLEQFQKLDHLAQQVLPLNTDVGGCHV